MVNNGSNVSSRFFLFLCSNKKILDATQERNRTITLQANSGQGIPYPLASGFKLIFSQVSLSAVSS